MLNNTPVPSEDLIKLATDLENSEEREEDNDPKEINTVEGSE